MLGQFERSRQRDSEISKGSGLCFKTGKRRCLLRCMGLSRFRFRGLSSSGSRSHHKQFLFRRIAWRIQALAEGGLSERARRRALEIANDADLRIQVRMGFDVGTPRDRRVNRRTWGRPERRVLGYRAASASAHQDCVSPRGRKRAKPE